MPGNSRSGRRPLDPPPIREGKPQRPAKLTADEAFFWDGVIAAAEHLEAIDTSLCQAATRAWGLYCKVCLLAAKEPIDRDIKAAVSTYGTLLDKLCARLAVDPLGRARHKPKRSVELDPLQAFMLQEPAWTNRTKATKRTQRARTRRGDNHLGKTPSGRGNREAGKRREARV